LVAAATDRSFLLDGVTALIATRRPAHLTT
jgi:hypothetical protein